MEKKDLRIVFMGTPEFAVESLKHLVEGGYNIVGVITMPDKPAGRGHKIQFSPVKEYALSQNLLLLQPERLKDEVFLSELKGLNADLQIVVAFRMLPEVVWNMPRLGTFNLHASLLPQYRGAAPINWAIINGDKETGATTFFLTHEIDTGKIIMQKRIPITEEDNAGTIHDQLMIMGASMVTETVDAIIAGKISPIDQKSVNTNKPLKPAPKIFKETCRIDWSKDARDVFNFIRGLSPHPAAWCEWIAPDRTIYTVKIFDSEIINGDTVNTKVGILHTDGKKFIEISCRKGSIRIKTLQLPGKKKLPVEDLLRGFHLTEEFSCL